MIEILHSLPVWLQLLICCTWLGLAAIMLPALIKPLNSWSIFLSIYGVLLICLLPSLIEL